MEDNPADAHIIKFLFNEVNSNTQIETACRGEEALDYLLEKRMRPALILLDINLPGLSGFEVLVKIKRHHECRNIPVVMLSTSGHASDIERSYQLNASAYVTKPNSVLELKQVIQAIEDFWMEAVSHPVFEGATQARLST